MRSPCRNWLDKTNTLQSHSFPSLWDAVYYGTEYICAPTSHRSPQFWNCNSSCGFCRPIVKVISCQPFLPLPLRNSIPGIDPRQSQELEEVHLIRHGKRLFAFLRLILLIQLLLTPYRCMFHAIAIWQRSALSARRHDVLREVPFPDLLVLRTRADGQ